VVAVLCFVRDEPLSGWARDVLVCSTANVVDFLLTRPEILPAHVVSEACLLMDARFRNASVTGPDSPASRPRASVTRQQVAAAFARPPAAGPGLKSRRTPARRTSRTRTRPAAGLVKLAVVAVIAAVFLGNPSVVTAVSEGVANLFVSQLVTQPPPVEQPVKKHRHPHKQHSGKRAQPAR
jgi:hypothetical protein